MYISSAVSSLRANLHPLSIRERLEMAVSESLDQYLANLRSGQIRIESTADMERIAKLAAVLASTADTIEAESTSPLPPTAPEVIAALDTNGESEKDVFNKLYQRLNDINNQFK